MRMYHVTNVPVKKNKKGQAENQPDWEKVEVHVADDKIYDGKLVALPVACFTTTLYKGGLPTQSPYPRYVSGTKEKPKLGTEYWRVDVPFNLHKYKIFEMAASKSASQVHLLCLDKDDDTEMLLAKILIMNKNAELNRNDLGKYFPIDKVTGFHGPNDYCYDRRKPDNSRYRPIFVNVSFINPVVLNRTKSSWTSVEKIDKKFGDVVELTNDRPFSAYASEWGKKHIQSSWEKCVESLDNFGTVENLEQIKWFMEKGNDKIQQQWEDACKSRERELANQEGDVNEATETLTELSIDKPSDK